MTNSQSTETAKPIAAKKHTLSLDMPVQLWAGIRKGAEQRDQAASAFIRSAVRRELQEMGIHPQ